MASGDHHQRSMVVPNVELTAVILVLVLSEREQALNVFSGIPGVRLSNKP